MKDYKINRIVLLINILALVVLVGACSSGPDKIKVEIAVQVNGSLKITGPDAVVLAEIQRDSISWQNVFPVYRMPADTGMKDFQPVQPGKYVLKEKTLIFIPDTAFTAGQTYFLRFRNFERNKNAWAILKNHQKMGTASYTDLTFRK